MARTKRLSHSNIIRPLCGLIYGEYLTLVLDVTPRTKNLKAPGRSSQVKYAYCPPTQHLQLPREPHRISSPQKEYVLSDVLVYATALLDYGQRQSECGSHKKARLRITSGRFIRRYSLAERRICRNRIQRRLLTYRGMQCSGRETCHWPAYTFEHGQ